MMHISYSRRVGPGGPIRQSPPLRRDEAREHRRRDGDARDLERAPHGVALVLVAVDGLRQREAAHEAGRAADDGAGAERAEPCLGTQRFCYDDAAVGRDAHVSFHVAAACGATARNVLLLVRAATGFTSSHASHAWSRLVQETAGNARACPAAVGWPNLRVFSIRVSCTGFARYI